MLRNTVEVGGDGIEGPQGHPLIFGSLNLLLLCYVGLHRPPPIVQSVYAKTLSLEIGTRLSEEMN